MSKDLLSLVAFFCLCSPLLIPGEFEKLKEMFSTERKSAVAYTSEGYRVKAYRSREEALCHRAKVKVGTTIYLPNGNFVHVLVKGIDAIESDGWWYAWTTI